MPSWKLVDCESNQVVVENLEVADGFWSRLIGLQFRKHFPAGAGFLLIPCGSIHTCWMRFAIDLAGINGRGEVVALRRNVKPWRAVILPSEVYCVLELPTGALHPLEEGSTVAVVGAPKRRSLQFLQKSID